MKRLIALICCVALSACATLGSPETPQQKLYASLATYEVAVHAAADYATSPNANKSVVLALDSVVNSTEAKTAVEFAETYVQCKNGLVSPRCAYVLIDNNALRYAVLLSSLATQLIRSK